MAAGIAMADGGFQGQGGVWENVGGGEVGAVAARGEGEDLSGHLRNYLGSGRKVKG